MTERPDPIIDELHETGRQTLNRPRPLLSRQHRSAVPWAHPFHVGTARQANATINWREHIDRDIAVLGDCFRLILIVGPDRSIILKDPNAELFG